MESTGSMKLHHSQNNENMIKLLKTTSLHPKHFLAQKSSLVP